jgi:ubiquinone biosynthesis protein COQ9
LALQESIQQQPSLLISSKLGYARDETHRSQKTETKIQEKRREKKKKGRGIKNQTKKGEKVVKKTKTQKR